MACAMSYQTRSPLLFIYPMMGIINHILAKCSYGWYYNWIIITLISLLKSGIKRLFRMVLVTSTLIFINLLKILNLFHCKKGKVMRWLGKYIENDFIIKSQSFVWHWYHWTQILFNLLHVQNRSITCMIYLMNYYKNNKNIFDEYINLIKLQIYIIVKKIENKCDMFFPGESQPIYPIQYKQIVYIYVKNSTQFRTNFNSLFIVNWNIIIQFLLFNYLSRLCIDILMTRGDSQPLQHQYKELENDFKCDMSAVWYLFYWEYTYFLLLSIQLILAPAYYYTFFYTFDEYLFILTITIVLKKIRRYYIILSYILWWLRWHYIILQSIPCLPMVNFMCNWIQVIQFILAHCILAHYVINITQFRMNKFVKKIIIFLRKFLKIIFLKEYTFVDELMVWSAICFSVFIDIGCVDLAVKHLTYFWGVKIIDWSKKINYSAVIWTYITQQEYREFMKCTNVALTYGVNILLNYSDPLKS